MGVAMIIVIILIGLFTGIVTGLTGASGNMMVVPLVNMLLNFSIHDSIGVSLIVNVIASLAISYTYYKHGNIDIKLGIWIAIGSILGAQLGAHFADNISGVRLGGSFGIFMIVVGIMLWKRGFNRETLENKKETVKFKTQTQKILTTLILGFAVGIMSGIFGAGGGAMILLILIFVLNIPLRVAIGTSCLLMTITSCSGALGYALQGNLRLLPGLIMGLSAAGSGMVSARFANQVNDNILSKTVAIIFIVFGAVMTIIHL